MYLIYLYTFLSILIVSLISFVGAISLFISSDKITKFTTSLISLSAGTLLGGAVLHLLPEVIERNGDSPIIWLSMLGGVIIFFILEKIICWRHCHIPTSEHHPHPLGIMNLVGDGLHNFLDGIVIAGAFLVNIPLGITATIAVIAHEIPQEIADFGILIHAGYSRAKALFLNFAISLTSFLGAVITLIIGPKIDNFSNFIIPIAAGGFIYIAMADLIPELKKDNKIYKSIGQLFGILLGIAIMLALKYWFK